MSQIRDIIFDIAKNDHDLENSELNQFTKIDDFVVCRSVSDSANYKTRTIRDYVDVKIANDVEDKGALRLQGKVYSFNKSFKNKTLDVKKLLNWTTNKKLTDDELEDLIAIVGHNFVPKLRGLDAVSSRRDKNPTTIRDTFLTKEWDEQPKLQVINPEQSYAPKWAQDLEEGKRRKT